jgi:peptidoglycan/xylan/chitin deacetylase (PgdA/CDA1 family)
MILCHDTQAKDTTVQALPAIIEHYKNLGYTFKGIDDATYAPHQSVNN